MRAEGRTGQDRYKSLKKVSVVIPCYCIQDEWIERLMYCLTRQTIGFGSLEIVFVVDASPDDTFLRLKVQEELYPENIVLIDSAAKLGPGGARSLGIQYATGEYIAFMDQDDWIEPCMYEHLYEKAAQHNCDVAESYNTRDKNYVYHEGQPKRTGEPDRIIELKDASDRKAYFAKGEPERRKYWAKLYRRNFLLEEGLDFPKNLKYDDNYFKGMVFYHARRVYVLEEYLYHWMVNGASISMQNDFEAHFDRMRVELLKLEEYKRRGLLTVYHDEMEYIFLEQFYANTFNTICTRNGTIPMETFTYMRQRVQEYFPDYRNNPYISARCPVWAMGEWIENALLGIAQVRGRMVTVPPEVLKKIAPYSFLDLLEADVAQEELDWYCAIYNAFDKVAGRIDYDKLKKSDTDTFENGYTQRKAEPQKIYLWLHDGIGQQLTCGEPERLGLGESKSVVCIPSEDMELDGKTADRLRQEELLLDERYTGNGLIVERELLVAAGGVNRLIQAKWEYELALRIVQKAPIYILDKEQFDAVGIARDMGIEAKYTAEDGFGTDAYVLGRYAGFLKECGLFDTVLEALLTECSSCSRPQEAQHFLEEMLSHAKRYEKIYEATQPILIYLGPTYCYNILNVFARELGNALERQGERVEYYDTSKEDVNGLVKLAGKRYKASIGFQTWLMSVGRADGTGNLQDFIGGPKYNFIVDHPIWLDEQLCKTPKRFYVLTHDRNYQTFIEHYYSGVSGTYLLPPGGRDCGMPYGEEERIYDITFLGTYGDYRKKLQVIAACVPSVRFLAARFLRNMVKQPGLVAEAAFGMAVEHYGIALDDTGYRKLFFEMKAVIQAAMYYYREKVTRTLLDAGITLHVYGESWEESPFAEHPCLIKHPAVPAEKSSEVLGKSKISLNVMAWHKDGFTERIADSMLAGAVVVSDGSTQLEEEYANELVIYQLDKLQEIPEKVKKLLGDSERREKLAKRAREKALAQASWDRRAEQLLHIIEEEEI